MIWFYLILLSTARTTTEETTTTKIAIPTDRVVTTVENTVILNPLPWKKKRVVANPKPRSGPREVVRKIQTDSDRAFCPFGKLISPPKACKRQRECQTKMNINAYCSEKEICCQEKHHEYKSLCYDRRLPLFGEQKCETSYDCENAGALCKSKHCCPNFHSIANEPLRPPSHFYASNFSCSPGKPIPSGFQFAFCSNISSTIAYVGIVNKCGSIQHLSKFSKCQKDSDCLPGNICAWIVDDGMCFKNPEDCSKSTAYYVVVSSCYMAFVMMILYFLARTCYEHPLKISNAIPILALQLYSTTKKAEYEAFSLYGSSNMTKEQIETIVKNAAEKAWEEDENSINRPATEHLLNWFGYTIDYSDKESDEEKEESEVIS